MGDAVRFALFILTNIGLVWAFCQSFPPNLASHRRAAICFVYANGLVYFWLGLLSLGPNNSLYQLPPFRFLLILPMAQLFRTIRTCVSAYPCALQDLQSPGYDTFGNLSPWVIAASLIAIGAALTMARNFRMGYYVSLFLIILAASASLWHALLWLAAAPTWSDAFIQSPEYMWPVILSASLAIAYVIARRDAGF